MSVTVQLDWKDIETILISTAKEVFGETSGKGAYNEKESWWWNDEVQRTVINKKTAFKRYQQTKAEQDQRLYRKASKEAKKSVAIAKEHAFEELYDKLDSKEGPTIIYKLAKSRERRTRDLTDIAFVKDRDGKILTDGESIRTRWKGYFQLLFNVENDREELQEVKPTKGPLPLYSVEEVMTCR